MPEFTNVTIVKNANVYFDGKVVSRSVIFTDGEKKTLGFMQPGEYEFATGAAENMEILSGQLQWRLEGQHDWISVGSGESFDVPANSSFEMHVLKSTDYCCSFLK